MQVEGHQDGVLLLNLVEEHLVALLRLFSLGLERQQI